MICFYFLVVQIGYPDKAIELLSPQDVSIVIAFNIQLIYCKTEAKPVS